MSNDENKKKVESVEKLLNMFGPKGKDSVESSAKGGVEKKKPEETAKFNPVEKPLNLPKEEVKPQPVVDEVEEDEIPVPKKESKSKSFPLEKLKENLKPELKEAFKKATENVSKETVTKLITYMENNKDQVFDSSVTNVFENLSLSDASTLSKKMAEWEVPTEAGEVNASVIIAWLNKTKK